MQQNKNTQQHPQTSSSNMISRTNLLPIQSYMSCKICLQKGGEMISPCQCKGSLQFVHENCIKQWLKHHLKKTNQFEDDGGSKYQKCEICNYQIVFNYVTTNYCSCQSFFQRIKTKKSLCSYIIALFVLLSGLGGFLYLLINLNGFNLSSIVIVVAIIFQTLFSVGFLLIVVGCIFEYFISKKILISRILSKSKMINGQ